MERGSVNIAPPATGFEVLSRFEEAGYTLAIEGAELQASGPAAPTEELRVLVERHRDALKVAVLFSDLPDWLAKLFDLYWSGHETPVRLTTPKGRDGQGQLALGDEEPRQTLPYPDSLRGGKTDVYMVRLSLKNICAAVAAETGAPVLGWERFLPEVEEALGTWASETKEGT